MSQGVEELRCRRIEDLWLICKRPHGTKDSISYPPWIGYAKAWLRMRPSTFGRVQWLIGIYLGALREVVRLHELIVSGQSRTPCLPLAKGIGHGHSSCMCLRSVGSKRTVNFQLTATPSTGGRTRSLPTEATHCRNRSPICECWIQTSTSRRFGPTAHREWQRTLSALGMEIDPRYVRCSLNESGGRRKHQKAVKVRCLNWPVKAPQRKYVCKGSKEDDAISACEECRTYLAFGGDR